MPGSPARWSCSSWRTWSKKIKKAIRRFWKPWRKSIRCEQRQWQISLKWKEDYIRPQRSTARSQNSCVWTKFTLSIRADVSWQEQIQSILATAFLPANKWDILSPCWQIKRFPCVRIWYRILQKAKWWCMPSSGILPARPWSRLALPPADCLQKWTVPAWKIWFGRCRLPPEWISFC